MTNNTKPQVGLQSNPYIKNAQNSNIQKPQVSPNANINQPSPVQNALSSFDTGNFLKGALIGAVGAYLLTNEDAQKKIFKTLAKGADLFSAGIEEMKERMEDAKAELEAEREAQ